MASNGDVPTPRLCHNNKVALPRLHASMLGIPTFKKGDDTKLEVISAERWMARGRTFSSSAQNGKPPRSGCVSTIWKEALKERLLPLGSYAGRQFTQLGQIINVKGRNEPKSNRSGGRDFGLLLLQKISAQPKAQSLSRRSRVE